MIAWPLATLYTPRAVYIIIVEAERRRRRRSDRRENEYEIDQSIKSNFISVFSYQTMAPTKSSAIGCFFSFFFPPLSSCFFLSSFRFLFAALITRRGHIWSRIRFISWSPAAILYFLAIYSAAVVAPQPPPPRPALLNSHRNHRGRGIKDQKPRPAAEFRVR